MTGVLITGLLVAAVIVWQGIRRIKGRGGIPVLAAGAWLVWSSWALWAQVWTPVGALLIAIIAIALSSALYIVVERSGAQG